MANLKRYTVVYHSLDKKVIEGCFYASDAFDARALAIESNIYIREHPNCIDEIRCEDIALVTS